MNGVFPEKSDCRFNNFFESNLCGFCPEFLRDTCLSGCFPFFGNTECCYRPVGNKIISLQGFIFDSDLFLGYFCFCYRGFGTVAEFFAEFFYTIVILR